MRCKLQFHSASHRVCMSSWLVACCLLSIRFAHADDWPTYRHDHRRSAVSTESPDIQKMVEVWQWKSATPPLAAWPGPARWDAYAGLRGLRAMRNYDPAHHVIVADGGVYFASNSDDSVRRVDAATGKLKWTFTADGPVRVAPEFVDGRLYFGADDGSAYCIDAEHGKLVWRQRPHEPDRWLLNDGRLISPLPIRSGVLVRDGLAYFTASLVPWKESFICCVNAETGAVADGFVSSVGTGKTLEGAMLASKSDLILPQGRVAPLVYDLKSGKDKGRLEGGGGSFVLLTEDDHVLHGPGNKAAVIVESGGTNKDKKTALDVVKEKIGLKRKTVASYENGNAIVVSGDTSYLLSDRSLAAYDRKSKKIRWLVPTDAPFDLILAGETLFAAGQGLVAGYSTTDGTLVWSADVDGRAHGLAFADGRLYATTATGTIHCFAAGDTTHEQPLLASAHQTTNQPISTVTSDSPPIAQVRERGLLDRWVFQRNGLNDPNIKNQSRPLTAIVSGRMLIKPAGELEALELDGVTNDVLIKQEFDPGKSPTKALTTEAWVRIDEAIEWGGLISISQDNGSYERGWILGFRNQKFGFAVAAKQGNGSLTWITAPDDFALGSWHHVAGVYDGEMQKLFVDGKLVAESKEQRGDIRYPENGRYVVGSYWDKDEHFRTKGALHEVRLYERALDDRMIARHAAEKAGKFPEPAAADNVQVARLAAGPILRFQSDGGAVVQWETHTEEPSKLSLYADTRLVQEHGDETPKTKHQLRLDPMTASTLFHYRIHIRNPDKDADAKSEWLATQEYGCDTHFNYARMNGSNVSPMDSSDSGLAIVVDDIAAAESLFDSSPMYVTLVSRDKERIAEARDTWTTSGRYGPRLTARMLDERLPSHAVSLVVAPAGAETGDLVGLLQPGGRLMQNGEVIKTGQPFDGASTWTHMYGRPDNTAFAGEGLSGAKSYDDLTLQWLGRPGPRYQSDRGNRKPAPLAAGGRLYMQGLNRIIAVNAYSGIILWSVELPELQRFNVPRDSCNWCADDEHLWISMGERVWQIDGATGKMLESRPITRPTDSDKNATWGFLARVEGQLFGTAVASGGHFKDWWGGASWYDAKDGALAHKVCSMNLTAFDADTGEVDWEYDNGGAIVNPTITIVDDLVIFAENRNLSAKNKSRFDDTLFDDLRMVALDRDTGSVRWEKPIKQLPGTVASYIAATKDGIVYVSSKDGKFEVSLRDPKDGETKWKKEYPWEVDHHGKHLSRPAIVSGRIVVRPHVIDMKSGDTLDHPFPKGHQCGTYTCSENALFLRAGDLTMWNLEEKQSSKLTRVRPDCWISTIPALGMLLSPEGGGGCSCGSWLETSMGFIPNAHAKR